MQNFQHSIIRSVLRSVVRSIVSLTIRSVFKFTGSNRSGRQGKRGVGGNLSIQKRISRLFKCLVLITGVFTPALFLSGCTYSSTFDCPVGEGNQCSSISQNVKKVDRGEYDPVISLDSNASEKQFYFREDFQS